MKEIDSESFSGSINDSKRLDKPMSSSPEVDFSNPLETSAISETLTLLNSALDTIVDYISTDAADSGSDEHWGRLIYSFSKALQEHTQQSISKYDHGVGIQNVFLKTRCILYILIERKILKTKLEQLLLDHLSCLQFQRQFGSSVMDYEISAPASFIEKPHILGFSKSSNIHSNKRFSKSSQLILEQW
uniref:Mating-type protein ALPHA2 n=1 Tax=Ogataea thermomethanolica (nom. inval.) TaxID=310468 RepID=A0A5P8D2X0_9ASCO|nr:mating-type protein ALPHA2 [Ogataea thermomethanolica (nom. inval.)]QGW56842.1 mating-type protein ALPHA2 [Ogataea thermomethanolica (nom. inval.)]